MELSSLVNDYVEACIKYATAREDDEALFYKALKSRGMMANEAINQFYNKEPMFNPELHSYKPAGDIYELLTRIAAEKRAALLLSRT